MKYILLVLLSIVLSTNNLQAGENGSLNEFQSVTPISGGVRITFKSQGIKYNFKIGDKERRIGAYNESVDLLFGQHAEFASNGLSIVLDSGSGNQNESLKVRKEIDLRSIGGPLKIEEFSMAVQSGVIIYGEKTTN